MNTLAQAIGIIRDVFLILLCSILIGAAVVMLKAVHDAQGVGNPVDKAQPCLIDPHSKACLG